jgi:carboxynorspermidine decarboxylase
MIKKIKTPYYLIDENKILNNLKKIKYIKDNSGVKILLALKCFSTWSVFNLMSKYMDGTTSSSLYEAKIGYKKFGKETQIFCVSYSKEDINILKNFCDKIIFNSISQFSLFYNNLKNINLGIRINTQYSYSQYDLANPSRKYSKLGVISKNEIEYILDGLSGVMFHCNCENYNFKIFNDMLNKLSIKYKKILDNVKWVSIGGGISFTNYNYPLDLFCNSLRNFSKKHNNIQIYLEPGEASITNSCELVTTVLDITTNIKKIAIVDSSIEAHMLDLLIYRIQAKINIEKGNNEYIIAGNSCLAGDVFGTYKIKEKLSIGSIIRFVDAAGYTMVKKNWFNGLKMPSIVVKKLDNKIKIIKKFSYNDFVKSLS